MPIANVDLDGAEPKPAITGNEKEGQSQTTSETIIPPSDAANDTPEVHEQTWYWHQGWVANAVDYKISEAGWYTAKEYGRILNVEIGQLAGYAGLFNSVAGHNWTDEQKADVANTRLGQFLAKGISEDGIAFLSNAASKAASNRNMYVSGYVSPSGFNVEDMLGVGLLVKGLIKGLATKSFYSVQNLDDIARLKAGGLPWPSAPNKSEFGLGLYAWSSKKTANAYMQHLQNIFPEANLSVVSFSINRFSLMGLRKVNLLTAPEKFVERFVAQHSKIHGAGRPHNYQHVIAPTGLFDAQYYFSKDIFHLFKIK